MNWRELFRRIEPLSWVLLVGVVVYLCDFFDGCHR